MVEEVMFHLECDQLEPTHQLELLELGLQELEHCRIMLDQLEHVQYKMILDRLEHLSEDLM